jgi:hypothetical protein
LSSSFLKDTLKLHEFLRFPSDDETHNSTEVPSHPVAMNSTAGLATNSTLDSRFIFDVPTVKNPPCPKGQRKDRSGRCKEVINE